MGNTHNIDGTKNSNIGLLILRVGIGVLFFLFGWNKITGGEAMWTGVGNAMQVIGISAWPTFWGLLASIAEFGGGLLLILGLFTRFAAISLIITMIVATLLKMSSGGGLMEFYSPLTMLLINIFFALNGGGTFSLDNYLRNRRQLTA